MEEQGNGRKKRNTGMPENVRAWRLNDISSARKRLAKILTAFHADPKANVQRFRAEVLALGKIVDALRIEGDLRIEEELEALKEELVQLRGRR